MRRDIAAAYAMTGARIVGLLAITAVVYRQAGKDQFGLLFLVLTTIGILEYASLGLSPAMIHFAAKARAGRPDALDSSVDLLPVDSSILQYESLAADSSPGVARVYAHGFRLGVFSAILAAMGLVVLEWLMGSHAMFGGRAARVLVGGIGAGTVLRLLAEAPGAILQTTGRIAADNLLQGGAEIVWAVGSITAMLIGYHWDWSVGGAFVLASALLLAARLILARRAVPAGPGGRTAIDWRFACQLLGFGLLVVAAQLADYLYAPTDLILIDRLIGRGSVADYAPGVQVDSALLLLVAAVASVLLPRTALVHARGNAAAARRYYVRGTLATAGLLMVAAGSAIAFAPMAFRIWLGDPMPATVAILPLMLINTVIGGSGAVGRSVLLATGKVRAFTVSVLVAGAINVVTAYVFVVYAHMGLRGIVFGTIVAVVARCVLWMPWYILRSLPSGNQESPA